MNITNSKNIDSPPHDLELEKSVLGSLILDKTVFDAISNIIKTETFFYETHQLIYSAILQLFANSEPIDLKTTINQLKKNDTLEEVGGAYYIATLTANAGGAIANIKYYAKVLVELAMRRNLIDTCVKVQENAYNQANDVFDLINVAEQSIFQITSKNVRESYKSITSIAVDAIQSIQTLSQSKGKLTGVPSGFYELDAQTSGWQKSDLVVVAARPGMGKTAFVLSAIRNATVVYKKPIALFSLEMSSAQLIYRLLAGESNVSITSIRNGLLEDFEWEKIINASSTLSKAPLFIDDSPALSIFELRTKARRLKAKHDIQMIVVDYLQLMTGDTSKKSSNREQEISSISRGLKTLAKELDVPVIALSQLSRAVEARGGSKRPMLSDLRESGAIEQDADMVILLYRPDYYGISENHEGESLKDVAEVIIAKFRNGSQGTISLQFIDKFTKFSNLKKENIINSKMNGD